jgi:tetratricopeptide (TPR) repeat protein
MFVIARNSTFTYKGKPVKVQQVAEDLGIRYVLEGSVQTSDEQIRITAQLIDAITGNHLWAEHYDRNLQDIFALQDEITSKVITSLQLKLTEGEYAHTVAKSTKNLRALEHFWKAEYHFFRMTKEDNEVAQRWLEKAIETDPKFSSAWALMGLVHLLNIQYGWSDSFADTFNSMDECAQKALSLDDSNPKAHCLMSNVHYMQLNFDQAIVSGEKSVDLAPNDHNMLGSLALILVYAGKQEVAVGLAKKAMRLNPYYEDYFLEVLGDAYFYLGQYEKSLNAYKNLLDRNPQYGINHIKLAGVYSELGRAEDAKAHAEEALRLNPNFSIEGLSREWPLKNQTDEDRRRNALRKAGFM